MIAAFEGIQVRLAPEFGKPLTNIRTGHLGPMRNKIGLPVS
jgi:hypothetical protein